MTETTTAQRKSFVIGALPRDVIADMTGLEVIRGMIDRSLPVAPIGEHMGFWLTGASEGHTEFEGRPDARMLNPQGTVHGGWIATVLDSAMGSAVHTLMKPGEIYVSTSMTNNFLRGVQAGETVRCEGTATHRGRTLAAAEARLVDSGGRLLAHGIQTCAILANRG